MNLLPFVAGAAAGGLVALVYSMSDKGSGGQTTHTGDPPSVLRGKIVPGPEASSPAETGLVPLAGVASREGYEWAYVWGIGDDPGNVARAITGDDGRYQELLAANPHVPTTGDPGVYTGPSVYEFEAGQPVPGEVVLLPLPWSRYIDQLGNARGGTKPFPPDGRALPSHGPSPVVHAVHAGGVEVNEYVYSPPPPRRLGTAERVPYGVVALYDEREAA
jgi:hypothetical protein